MDDDERDIPKPKSSKPKGSKPKSTSSSSKQTPAFWMGQLQRYKLGPRRGQLPRVRVPHWQHNAAAALHGWGQHQHDENAPIELSQSDYEKALEATERHPLKPHKGALSKHCRHNFKG